MQNSNICYDDGMIEVTLSWMVNRPKAAGGSDCLTAVTDFVLDDSASSMGPSALRDSLLRQLSTHFAETVFYDVIRLAELPTSQAPRK